MTEGEEQDQGSKENGKEGPRTLKVFAGKLQVSCRELILPTPPPPPKVTKVTKLTHDFVMWKARDEIPIIFDALGRWPGEF